MRHKLFTAITAIMAMGMLAQATWAAEMRWRAETTSGKPVEITELRHQRGTNNAPEEKLHGNIDGNPGELPLANVYSLTAKPGKRGVWQVTLTNGKTAEFDGAGVWCQWLWKTDITEAKADHVKLVELVRLDVKAPAGAKSSSPLFTLEITTKSGNRNVYKDIQVGKPFKVGSSTCVLKDK